MKKGKIIVIEGTDCSGKETQSNKIVERLQKENYNIKKSAFPMYDTPTGRIVGGAYLGKEYIGKCFFPEGAINIDPKIAALYYAADRKYNINKITEELDKGISLIIDRYVESNMAHQGGKYTDKKERHIIYEWIDKLEYGFLELPKPDITILLYMPYKYIEQLRKNRTETADQHEKSPEHLKAAENAYLELAEINNYHVINCIKDNKIKTIDEIHNEIYNYIKNEL